MNKNRNYRSLWPMNHRERPINRTTILGVTFDPQFCASGTNLERRLES